MYVCMYVCMYVFMSVCMSVMHAVRHVGKILSPISPKKSGWIPRCHRTNNECGVCMVVVCFFFMALQNYIHDHECRNRAWQNDCRKGACQCRFAISDSMRCDQYKESVQWINTMHQYKESAQWTNIMNQYNEPI